jgi:hypothetical protein
MGISSPREDKSKKIQSILGVSRAIYYRRKSFLQNKVIKSKCSKNQDLARILKISFYS